MRILFVCTGNTCRSPMAEVMFNGHTPNREWEAASAGIATWDGMMATPLAFDEMEARGLSLGHHRSRQINEAMLDAADLVLTMTSKQKEELVGSYPDYAGKVYVLAEYVGLPGEEVLDPYGLTADDYLETANQLVRLIQALFDKLAWLEQNPKSDNRD